ncbi:chitinase-3-like protein 2 [Ostrinia nubilalis]|uniref:chitinase-3-like protein 2 n=1 Tax=Ostrinia nubilalis TaxID=29057 RepID=UPI0030825443
MLDKGAVYYQKVKGPALMYTKSVQCSKITNTVKTVVACGALLVLVATTLILIQPELPTRIISKVPTYFSMKSYFRAKTFAILRGQQLGKTKLRALPPLSDEEKKIVSCYYNTPSANGTGQLLPADIHPHLCTHINVAFARVVNKEIHLDDVQYQALRDIVKLKKVNPDLKILISVGGSGNEDGFSDMVINHASRKVFIRSLKWLLRNYTLDGVDLDWEFPAVHLDTFILGGKRERQHFSQLLYEIRREYIREKRDYLLTVAVAAPETIVDISYDIDQINLYTDYVNVMTYDFHYFTKYTPFTGFNSPLFARHGEQMYLASLNINYTVHMYYSKGLSLSKIVVGIPTYGHTFTLVNPGNTRVGSPASGYGSLGGMGFVSYPEICTFVKKFKDVIIQEDVEAKVPYLYRGREWVSFESPQSVAAKAAYVRAAGLRGAMIYSLNADDYSGVCRARGGQLKFPLLQSIKNSLFGNDTAN